MDSKDKIGFFSFNGRAGRMEYFIASLAANIFPYASVAAILYFYPDRSFRYTILILIISYIFFFITLPISVRRLHDTNRDAFAVLIMFVPNICNILSDYSVIFSFIGALSIIPYLYIFYGAGTEGANNYGEPNPPKKYTKKSFYLLYAAVILATIVTPFFR